MASEAQIERAFLRGVASIVDPVNASALRRAIAAGDTDEVIRILDIEPAAFSELRDLLVQTFGQSGAEELTSVNGVRWNSASPRVEDYARNQVGMRITRITNDMMVAVRNSVADGYAFGRSPARMALDLVGRVGANGHRQGGIVGLSSQQERWVTGMRNSLLGGEPAKFWIGADGRLKSSLTKRDRRFDAVILKSLQTGKPLTQDQIDRITRNYSNKLLLSRGKTIARTERGLAVNAGRFEAWRQAADKLGVSPDRIRKQWIHTGRAREDRPDHQAANKMTVRGLDTPFIIGGVAYAYPHDPSVSAQHSINCMCEVKIWLA